MTTDMGKKRTKKTAKGWENKNDGKNGRNEWGEEEAETKEAPVSSEFVNSTTRTRGGRRSPRLPTEVEGRGEDGGF
ncbi:MAG: hypothetical protein LBP95_04035 [Deltaproteobacteria bacterium]|jgi:hypothetical protein|nr:hypothetical protein [Deltaproteobacteria bacterium]